MGKILAQKIFADLNNLKEEIKATHKSIPAEYNGNIVIEKLNEIVNRVTI